MTRLFLSGNRSSDSKNTSAASGLEPHSASFRRTRSFGVRPKLALSPRTHRYVVLVQRCADHNCFPPHYTFSPRDRERERGGKEHSESWVSLWAHAAQIRRNPTRLGFSAIQVSEKWNFGDLSTDPRIRVNSTHSDCRIR